MTRAWLVVGMASAGVWLLAGAGWGLVCAAVLVYAMWPRLAVVACALGRVSRGFAAARSGLGQRSGPLRDTGVTAVRQGP